MAAIEVLREFGPQLGRPLVDSLTASRHRNMKELRPGSSGRSELRVLFAFDPSAGRSCWWPATRPGTGRGGTRRTSRWPTTCSTTTYTD
ncbi:MAG: type II toxin-antitoxin system RelE/ParE family toxin [Micropruina sp.]|uniref:type II toxin-antitoxin system RelE/ParE family toxin n=1 Tax=Micropruina sp. TaxID=2737536 RepID=UPI0039E4E0A8